jgi:hypothetical protein
LSDPGCQALASFQLALEAEAKSPKTVESYTNAVSQSPNHWRDHDLLEDVTTVTAGAGRRWLSSLQCRVAPSTEYATTSGCASVAWCVREGELDRSPMEDVRPP